MSDAIESCGCESEPHQCVEADPAITMLQADLAARDAEIARLTAELAAARAVPPDVEAAIKSTVNGAEEAGRCAALGHAYPITKAPFWTVPRLKDTIARAISDATASKPATVGGLLATEADALLCRWYAAKQDAIGAFVDLENLRRPDPDDSWSGGIGRRDYMTGAEKRAADTKERLVDVTNKVIAAMTRGPIGEG